MKRILLTLVCILTATVLCSAQTTLYLPQIVDGGDGFSAVPGTTWSTAIGVTNAAATGSAAASGTITFTQSNGTPFNIPFTDPQGNPVGSGNTLSFSLSGGQSTFFESTGAETLTVGFGTVTSSLPITIAAVFLETVQPVVGPAISYSAGVAAVSPVTSQAVFVIQQESTSTAIAIANPNNSPADVSFQLLTGRASLLLLQSKPLRQTAKRRYT